MNILLLASHFNTGGITSYLLNLSEGLAGAGHRVFIASDGGNCVGFLDKIGVAHLRLDVRVKSEAHPKLWLSLPALVHLIRKEKIDIIHANARVTQVIGAVASRLTGVPLISTAHGFFRPRLFRRIFPCWGEAVIAISRGVRDHMVKDFHVDERKVSLISNGIDVSKFHVLNEADRQTLRQQWRVQGNPVIGIIARLSTVKGIDILIKAMPTVLQQFPKACLWIVGEGPEKQRLQENIEAAGLSRAISFEPIINRTADILPVFDIFVMPSLQEGLGLSVMEAQAAGIPVIASNVGGLPELITNGKTGILVPPGQSDVLAAAIIDLLKHPEQAKFMAEAARKQVQERFSQTKMVEETINLYKSIMGYPTQKLGKINE